LILDITTKNGVDDKILKTLLKKRQKASYFLNQVIEEIKCSYK
jgi:hypothetical protein